MKKTVSIILIFLGFVLPRGNAQTLDTLVSAGNGHSLRFTIIKGKGTPILFESGLGNSAGVWTVISKPIARATGATVICYDRLSFGENRSNYLVDMTTEMQALETALQKLGYAGKPIMLVSHSLGGMYNSFYASRHPNDVKAAVFIDDANCCSLRAYFPRSGKPATDTVEQYLAQVLKAGAAHPLPLTIPLIDIVADNYGNPDTAWVNCHKAVVAESPSRQYLQAYNVGHHIFIDNPPLVINAIVGQYARYVAPNKKAEIIEKGFLLQTEIANEYKRTEVKQGRSEDDINGWGYELLEKNNLQQAIAVFHLNVVLHPESWNVYDSLGEAYLKAGNTALAIANYEKSLGLNPKNENAAKVLKQLKP